MSKPLSFATKEPPEAPWAREEADNRKATIAFAQNICSPYGVTVRTTTGCDNTTSSASGTSPSATGGSASAATNAASTTGKSGVASTTGASGAAPTDAVLRYVGNAVGLAAAAGAFAVLL